MNQLSRLPIALAACAFVLEACVAPASYDLSNCNQVSAVIDRSYHRPSRALRLAFAPSQNSAAPDIISAVFSLPMFPVLGGHSEAYQKSDATEWDILVVPIASERLSPLVHSFGLPTAIHGGPDSPMWRAQSLNVMLFGDIAFPEKLNSTVYESSKPENDEQRAYFQIRSGVKKPPVASILIYGERPRVVCPTYMEDQRIVASTLSECSQVLYGAVPQGAFFWTTTQETSERSYLAPSEALRCVGAINKTLKSSRVR